MLVDTLFFSALTPLLPHYADTLGLGKGGAGLLIRLTRGDARRGDPERDGGCRFGVKPTVLVGLIGVAVTTALFGLATSAWQLDVARFMQGLASSFSWTGSLSWLVARAPKGEKGS